MIEYKCSVHGEKGSPECKECWYVLSQFLNSENDKSKRRGGKGLYITGDLE